MAVTPPPASDGWAPLSGEAPGGQPAAPGTGPFGAATVGAGPPGPGGSGYDAFGPPPPPAAAPAWSVPTKLTSRHTEAGDLARILALAAWALGFAALASGVGSQDLFIYPFGALVSGIVIGYLVDVRRIVRGMPGLVAGGITLVVLFTGWAIVAANSRTPVSVWPVFVGAIIVAGVDWYWCERLRSLVMLSGLLLVPALSQREPWALALAIVWFLVAATALWALERDVRRATPQLTPLTSAARSVGPMDSGLDAARLVGVAGVVALSLALLIGNPSCSPKEPPAGAGGAASGAASSGAGRSGGAGGAGGGGGGGGGGGAQSGRGYYDADGGFHDSDGGYTDPAGNYTPGDGSGSGSGSRSGSGAGGVVPDGNGGFYDGDGGHTDRNGGYTDRDGNYTPPEASRSGSGNGSRSGSGSGSAQGTPAAPEPASTSPDLGPLLKLLLLLMLIVALVAIAGPPLWRWAGRTEPTRSWAEDLAARLDHEGRRRGRPRHRHETVRDYASSLAGDELPDARLAAVGDALSDALFGRSAPTPDQQAWMTEVVDEVTARNPPPSWTDRFRRHDTPSAAPTN